MSKEERAALARDLESLRDLVSELGALSKRVQDAADAAIMTLDSRPSANEGEPE